MQFPKVLLKNLVSKASYFKMMRTIIVLSLIFSISTFILSAQPVMTAYERVYQDIHATAAENGQTFVTLNDGTRCEFFLNNGIKDGPWVSYYPDGTLKAKGWFSDNMMFGKWKLYADRKKKRVVLHIDSLGNIVLKNVRLGFLNRPICNGRGQVEIKIDDVYSGRVLYRKGRKNGAVVFYHPDGSKYADLHFKNGLYHGKCTWYKPKDRSLFAEYQLGLPVGIWKSRFPDGTEKIIADYIKEPYIQRVPERLFIQEQDVLYTQHTIEVIPCTNTRNNELFEPDMHGNTFYSILQNAFINDHTVFYRDVQLNNPVFFGPGMTNLSGLPDSLDRTAHPVMFCLYNFYYFTTQLGKMSNMILQFNVILQYVENDHIKYCATPFLYFPMVYYELGNSELHGKLLNFYLSRILNGYYYSVPVYFQNIKEQFLYDLTPFTDWIQKSRHEELKRFDWLMSLMLNEFGVYQK